MHLPTFPMMTLNYDTIRSNGFQPDMLTCNNMVMLNINYAKAMFSLYIFVLILRLITKQGFNPGTKSMKV